MRKISLVFFGCFLTACSGFGEYVSDTFQPMSPAEAPIGAGENFRRVHDGVHAVVVQPLAMESGNVWPGRVEPVPSIQDVSNIDSHFNRSFQSTLKTLDTQLETVQLKEHETLLIGEEASAEVGVHRKSNAVVPGALPSEVPDPAHHYMEATNRDAIYIANGDGTTTIVMPNGDVHVVRGDPKAIEKAQKERKISSESIIVPPYKQAAASSIKSTKSTKNHKLKKTTEMLNEEALAQAEAEDGIVDHVENAAHHRSSYGKKKHAKKHSHRKRHHHVVNKEVSNGSKAE